MQIYYSYHESNKLYYLVAIKSEEKNKKNSTNLNIAHNTRFF